MKDTLSYEDRKTLLKIARQSLEEVLNGQPLSEIDYRTISPQLKNPGVTFVTLTIHGELRGCVGALEAYQPLVEDVREHALAAAMKDYRFPPLEPKELPQVEIEISRLTQPKQLKYDKPEELPRLIRPHIDGVILQDGMRRATFLPQVWEKLPEPGVFLSHLCQKMGANPSLWMTKKITVSTYQVEMFSESEFK